jgi:hypothetical protein
LAEAAAPDLASRRIFQETLGDREELERELFRGILLESATPKSPLDACAIQ